MDIYDIVPREDSAQTNPLTSWTSGISDESAAVQTPTDLQTTPFLSETFCLYWKVRKISKIELAQGRSHKHSCKVSPHYSMNYERIQKSPQIRDFTQYTLFVIYGSATNDNTVKTSVSTGGAKVDIVQSIKYHYYGVMDNTTHYNYASALATITTGESVSEGTGGVINDGAA